VRSRPSDLSDADVVAAVAEGWAVRAAAVAYVPEGGGSHHWRVTDRSGESLFVTVDDLDDKDWIAKGRAAVFDALRRALTVATSLRDEHNLDFVVAPIASVNKEVTRRLGSRYAGSVYPFFEGRSYPFGPHIDPGRRREAIDMVIAIHRVFADDPLGVRVDGPTFGGRDDLEVVLEHPDRAWDEGPFGEAARHLVAERASMLAEMVHGFDRLVEATHQTGSPPVITHGEPHAGNVMSVDGRLLLIDWDTVALARPERDLWLIATDSGEEVAHYSEATGHQINPAAMTLYRLRWYLDDIASAVRLFRRPHRLTEDTLRWWEGLPSRLEQLPAWNEELARLFR
jgi:spectinomycin phosphotransferase